MKNLVYPRLRAREHTLKRLRHFRFIVREHIKELNNDQFIELCLACLHEEHYPLFQALVEAQYAVAEAKTKKLIRYHKYLAGSHRKTLTIRLTELNETGYTAEVLEWLIVHNHWSN